ncbi:hypothetical protein KL86SPO_70542 [uncultured Sporomusa sp.]|uniref:Uncharacterized protein n=2 Tax=uncultured Sporomusa sp. TaxID=307249 RepID=A0A212M1J1_9FIRM|nr:hypothetical protein KL86SPO_70542 [uncultured Sporomusa sp.]
MIANYKKSYIDLGKNDGIDAFVIADFARVAELLLPLGVAASFSLCNA